MITHDGRTAKHAAGNPAGDPLLGELVGDVFELWIGASRLMARVTGGSAVEPMRRQRRRSRRAKRIGAANQARRRSAGR